MVRRTPEEKLEALRKRQAKIEAELAAKKQRDADRAERGPPVRELNELRQDAIAVRRVLRILILMQSGRELENIAIAQRVLQKTHEGISRAWHEGKAKRDAYHEARGVEPKTMVPVLESDDAG